MPIALRSADSAALLAVSAIGAGTIRPMKPIWRPISAVRRMARLSRRNSPMARRKATSSSGESEVGETATMLLLAPFTAPSDPSFGSAFIGIGTSSSLTMF